MLKYVYPLPKKLINDFKTYNILSELYLNFINSYKNKIIINFSETSYIEPNIMSSLGLIISILKKNNNLVLIRVLNGSNIQKILIKYKFLSCEDIYKKDIKENYILYKTFKNNDFLKFKSYINKHVLAISDFDIIDEIKTIFSELFVNVSMHSNTNSQENNIFSCGYYNPNKDYIHFSLTNKGNTFKDNISAYLNDQSINNSIIWALKRGNSTRKDTKGGLGLYMLETLVKDSNGTLFIVSGNEFLKCFFDTKTNLIKYESEILSGYFPGCSISVKIPLINFETKKSKVPNKISAINILKGGF